MVELPRFRDLSAFGKVLLAAATATVLAGMVLLVFVSGPSAQQPTWQVTAAEVVVAPAGLLAGCILILHASRDYLLGLGGVAVSVFVAILLAAFAGLTLYVTGFAPSTVAGVATSSTRQHLAVALALAGVLAAFLLIAMPWSPYRKVAQPCLIATAVLAPILALLSQDGPRASWYGFPELPGLGGDPVLVVASVGGLLAIPLVVASSIEWVSGCVGAGFRWGQHCISANSRGCVPGWSPACCCGWRSARPAGCRHGLAGTLAHGPWSAMPTQTRGSLQWR